VKMCLRGAACLVECPRPVGEIVGDTIIPVMELAGKKETIAAKQQLESSFTI